MLIHPLQSTRSYNLSRKLILSDFLSGVIFFWCAICVWYFCDIWAEIKLIMWHSLMEEIKYNLFYGKNYQRLATVAQLRFLAAPPIIDKDNKTLL